ncbi:MAG: class II glutamine amidotransferase [Arenicella sp.]
MCRWVAYIGESEYLNTMLVDSENSLIQQSISASKGDPAVNGDGFGLGWYSDRGEPAVYRDIMPAWHDPNMLELTRHIQSSVFFGHIRATTGTAVSRDNCHPFRNQGCLFMHNGMVQNYHKYKRRIESLLCDEYYGLRKGSTDSEVLFYLLLQFDFFVDPKAAVGRLIKTIETIIVDNNNADEADFLRMSLCLTDKNKIYLVRYATNPRPPSAFYKRTDKGWVISSEPTYGHFSEWENVGDSDLLIFDKDDVTKQTLDIN